MILPTRLLIIPVLCFLPLFLSVAATEGKSKGRVITLDEAYERTLSSDQAIAIAAIELQKAYLEPARAWVKYTPTLSASAGVTTRDNASSIGSRSSGSGGVSFQQPLFDPTFGPALRRGRLAVAAAGMDYYHQIRETLFTVAQAYYDVLSQQKLVEVDREALRLAEEQQTVAQNRNNVGEVTRADVLRSRVATETARRTLIEDSSTLASMKNTLANILNLSFGEHFSVAEPGSHSSNIPKFESLLQQALSERDDLRASDLVIRQNEERIKEVRAGYLPSIVASVDASSSDDFSSRSQLENDLQGGISLRIPLFSAGQKAIDVRDATLTTEQSRLQHQQRIKEVEQLVKDAWLDARRLDETLDIIKVQVEAAEVSYTDLQNQYKNGTATNLDVLTALNELNQARKDLAVETYRYQVALRNIERVSGSFQKTRIQQARQPNP